MIQIGKSALIGMASRMRTMIVPRAILAFAAVGFLTCDEALPPFDDPGRVIEGGVIRARYVLVLGDNSAEITLSIRHLYDETFEGVTNLNGSVSLVLDRLPSVHRTVVFDQTNLTTRQKYNSTTKVLRFDPGDSLIFRIRWDFVDDNGDSLQNTVFRYNVDPNCPLRCIADQEVFTVTASLRLFDEIPAATYGPERFELCHVSTWIDGMFCPPIVTATPCSYLPGILIPCDSTTN